MIVCYVCGTTNSGVNSQCEGCGEPLSKVQPIIKATPARDDALPTGTLLNQGRYRILHTVGRGGFAITYRAFDAKHGAYVAVKELFPENKASRNNTLAVIANPDYLAVWGSEVQRFQREAEILQSIVHPACVAPVDSWLENQTAYLAMEFLAGETLETRLLRRGTIYESEALGLLNILLEALVEVHSKGVLHRDLKPANIIVIDDYPEIVDFGSARNTSQQDSTRILTPAYAPLEQYGQNLQEHPATDLYALAATFYEAVTGYKPETALERAQGKALTAVQKRNPLIGEKFSTALEKALEMRIENRFKDANEMRVALGMGKVRPPISTLRKHALKSLWVNLGLMVLAISILLWSWFNR